MKIRRKAAKPRGLPYFIIGSSTPPDARALQAWFDLEYGGPLKLGPATTSTAGEHGQVLMAAHASWSVPVQLQLPPLDCTRWQERLGWRHTGCAAVLRAQALPAAVLDTVLHGARLARGMTVLTEGTAYDVHTGHYLNPSDWSNRLLSQFQLEDHVAVVQSDADPPTAEWFHTRGLSKFGAEEIEAFRPVGLPAQSTIEMLYAVAHEILRAGKNPSIGTVLPVAAVDRVVRIVRHRTVPTADTPLILREVTW